MVNKALRILMADSCQFRLFCNERMLNQLGYYRVGAVQSFNEVISLTDPVLPSFDLLIMNAALARLHNFDPIDFCWRNFQVRNAMVYQVPKQTSSLELCGEKVMARIQGLPDGDVMRGLMTVIDPESRNFCRRQAIAKYFKDVQVDEHRPMPDVLSFL